MSTDTHDHSPKAPPADAPNLYANYYASDRSQKWYEVCSVEKAQNILNACLTTKPASVLDVGAGNGAVLQRYVEGNLAPRVCAVEISDSGLHSLNQRKSTLEAKGDRRFAEARKFDGLTIPYPDSAFDLAILSHVLEHVEHPRALLHEIRRVANRLFVEVPLEACALKRNLRGDWVMDDTGHINYYNTHTLRRQLQTSGWRVDLQIVPAQRVEPYKFAAGTRGYAQWALKRAALATAPSLAKALFVYHCFVLCTRADLPPVSLGSASLSLAKPPA